MNDLYVQTCINISAKSDEFRGACLSGLISGLTIQLELLKNGVKYYDGSLVHCFRKNSQASVQVAFRGLGEEWEKLLSTGMVVGWNDYAKSSLATTYFANMGSGAMYVSKLFVELTSVGNMVDIEAYSVVVKVVENLVREFDKLF